MIIWIVQEWQLDPKRCSACETREALSSTTLFRHEEDAKAYVARLGLVTVVVRSQFVNEQ